MPLTAQQMQKNALYYQDTAKYLTMIEMNLDPNSSLGKSLATDFVKCSAVFSRMAYATSLAAHMKDPENIPKPNPSPRLKNWAEQTCGGDVNKMLKSAAQDTKKVVSFLNQIPEKPATKNENINLALSAARGLVQGLNTQKDVIEELSEGVPGLGAQQPGPQQDPQQVPNQQQMPKPPQPPQNQQVPPQNQQVPPQNQQPKKEIPLSAKQLRQMATIYDKVAKQSKDASQMVGYISGSGNLSMMRSVVSQTMNGNARAMKKMSYALRLAAYEKDPTNHKKPTLPKDLKEWAKDCKNDSRTMLEKATAQVSQSTNWMSGLPTLGESSIDSAISHFKAAKPLLDSAQPGLSVLQDTFNQQPSVQQSSMDMNPQQPSQPQKQQPSQPQQQPSQPQQQSANPQARYRSRPAQTGLFAPVPLRPRRGTTLDEAARSFVLLGLNEEMQKTYASPKEYKSYCKTPDHDRFARMSKAVSTEKDRKLTAEYFSRTERELLENVKQGKDVEKSLCRLTALDKFRESFSKKNPKWGKAVEEARMQNLLDYPFEVEKAQKSNTPEAIAQARKTAQQDMIDRGVSPYSPQMVLKTFARNYDKLQSKHPTHASQLVSRTLDRLSSGESIDLTSAESMSHVKAAQMAMDRYIKTHNPHSPKGKERLGQVMEYKGYLDKILDYSKEACKEAGIDPTTFNKVGEKKTEEKKVEEKKTEEKKFEEKKIQYNPQNQQGPTV